ncbi:unnamed protein product [Linum tenue]|uniref:Uncharacterized protein n=1 Tax=Linum tenue TaxID=586396 RepID=A0AAV0N0P4_9ROSI|nr:unnamed protein product [Linum tenue]
MLAVMEEQIARRFSRERVVTTQTLSEIMLLMPLMTTTRRIHLLPAALLVELHNSLALTQVRTQFSFSQYLSSEFIPFNNVNQE